MRAASQSATEATRATAATHGTDGAAHRLGLSGNHGGKRSHLARVAWASRRLRTEAQIAAMARRVRQKRDVIMRAFRRAARPIARQESVCRNPADPAKHRPRRDANERVQDTATAQGY